MRKFLIATAVVFAVGMSGINMANAMGEGGDPELKTAQATPAHDAVSPGAPVSNGTDPSDFGH